MLGRFVDWRWLLLALWLFGSSLFFGRAVSGRFVRPLPSYGLIALAVIAVIIALELRMLLRGSWRACQRLPSSRGDWFALLLPTLGVVLLATGLTVAGAYPTGLVLLWVLVAMEAIFGAGGPWLLPRVQQGFGRPQADYSPALRESKRGTTAEKPWQEPTAREDTTLKQPESVNLICRETESESNDELPWLWQEATALQELRYMTLPEQGLCVAGSQRVMISPTQTVAVVHTVFHPPFDAAPLVTLEMQQPDAITIKAAQVLPHGIRWELRAQQPTEQAREIQWAFTASSAANLRK